MSIKKIILVAIVSLIFTLIGNIVYDNITTFRYGFSVIWGATTITILDTFFNVWDKTNK